MRTLVFFIAIAMLLVACQTKDQPMKKAEQLSGSVAKQYAPDSREDHFDIRLNQMGSKLVVKGETTSAEGKKALLSSLQNAQLEVIDSLLILPEGSSGARNWGLVDVSTCNIRSKPGHSSEMTTQAILGTPVRILKRSGTWLFIQTPDRYLGWVDDDAISLTDSLGLSAWRSSKRVIYQPLNGVGVDPQTGIAVTDLVAGAILKLTGTTKTNMLAEMPDGRPLTIPVADAIEFDTWKNKPEPTAAALESCAKSLTGRPYLWGGTSSKGVDCSGFVKTVYFLNGIILARDASLQFRHGLFTDPQKGYQQLKPGDLVFFGRKAEGDKPARATHVGLYLGNGDYINSSGFVRIDSFDPGKKYFSQARADKWLGGRTILGATGTAGIVRVKDHPWY